MAKKSPSKVDLFTIVDPSARKGKRAREVVLVLSAKKLKKDEVFQQSIEKRKKVETSNRSEESYSSNDEPKVTAPAKKEDVKTKIQESSSDDSSDGESVDPPAKAAAKNGSVQGKKYKKDSSSDSESSNSNPEEEEPKAVALAVKNVTVSKTAKAAESSSSDDNSDESCEESSSNDDSSDESSEDGDAKPTKKCNVTEVPKKMDSSDSSSDDDSSEEEPPKKATAQKTAVAKKTQDSDDESGDKDSSEDSAEKLKSVNQKLVQESSDSDDESNGKRNKTPKDADVEMVDADVEMVDADVEMVDAESEKNEASAPKTPSTPQASGLKRLFAGNLSFKTDEANVRDFFQSVGEAVSTLFSHDQDARFSGLTHVEFATAEEAQKALNLNQKELLGRPMKFDLAHERGAYTPSSGKDNSSQQSSTIFVKGLDTSLGEDELRGVLEEHFGKCGEITRMSIPTNFETGGPKGLAYIDYEDNEAFQKALKLDQTEVGGFYLTVDEATPKEPKSEGAGSGRGGVRFGSGGRDCGVRFGRGGTRNCFSDQVAKQQCVI